MAPLAAQPRFACVLFLRAAAGGGGQALRAMLDTLLPLWPADVRLVAEHADGAAIVALDGPLHALQAAERAAAQPGWLLGLHHGPVAAVERGGQTLLTGDGLDTAQAVAGLAPGRPLAATREFQQVLRAAAPRQAQAWQAMGDFVDGRLRSHRLYAPAPGMAGRRRRRRTLLAAAGIAGVLALGGGVGELRQRDAAARRPAVIQLDIRPGGEVWVDGEAKGTSPPLSRLWLPPGPHTIEVRNGRLKPLRLDVQLRPGEELEVKHVFTFTATAPSARRPAPQERQRSLWERLKFW